MINDPKITRSYDVIRCTRHYWITASCAMFSTFLNIRIVLRRLRPPTRMFRERVENNVKTSSRTHEFANHKCLGFTRSREPGENTSRSAHVSRLHDLHDLQFRTELLFSRYWSSSRSWRVLYVVFLVSRGQSWPNGKAQEFSV